MSNSRLLEAFRSRAMMLGLALLVVAAVAVSLQSGEAFRFDDEMRYHDLAHSLLQKHAYTNEAGTRPSAWWPPGYPIALSAIYTLWDRPVAAKLFNCVFLGLAVWGVARLARRQSADGMRLTPFLAIGYPILLYTASCIYPQTLGALLLVSVISLVSAESLSWRSTALAGLVFGTLCLVIPAFLLLSPLLALFIVVAGRGQLQRAVLQACLLAGISILVVGAWTLRNYLAFHAFVPVSTNSGFNLLLGNSELTQPDRTPDFSKLCPESANPVDEVDFDHKLSKCATTWIRENPGKAARLYAGKVLNYFNYRNSFQTASNVSGWMNWIMFATYYPLLLLALIRAAMFRRYPINRTEALLYLFYFGNAFASAVFFTRLRFRVPFDLLLMAIDSSFLVWLLQRAWSKRAGGAAHLPA